MDLIAKAKEPEMRERKPVHSDKVRLCAECKGYYSNRYFYKHKCITKKPSAIKPALLKKANSNRMSNDKDFQEILNRFHDNEVGDLIRRSPTIQLIGYKHFNMRRHEEGKEAEVRKVIMSDMRELARLYLVFKEINGETSDVEDMFLRHNIQDLADATERMTMQDGQGEKHGLKLLLDAIILRGHYSEKMEDDKCKELKLFLTAYKFKSSEILPRARHECVKQSQIKARRPANLPDETQLQTLQQYI